MASPEERRGPERDDSCFSRAARALRRALSRICGHCYTPPDLAPLGAPSRDLTSTLYVGSLNIRSSFEEFTTITAPLTIKRTSEGQTSRGKKRLKTHSTTSSSGCSYEWHPPPAMTTYAPGAGQEPVRPLWPPQGRSALSSDLPAARDAFGFSSREHEGEPGGDADVLKETGAPVAAASYSVTAAPPVPGHPPPPGSRRPPGPPSRSHRGPSPSPVSSFEEFTPDITAVEDDETFRLRCSGPGLYLCSVTGLVFHMGGAGGEVVYRIVPWDGRLLARHHKQAAGPLFDVKCEQRSVLGLQLPHCEIRSGKECDFLSVAHVEDEGWEFLRPREVTETHVVVNVSRLSAFGNVRDENSPPQPVRALVLLFYRPPHDPDDPESLLNVLMLPGNVVLREVQRTRRKQVGPERYIETSPHCKLHPDREYVLSTSPQDDRVTVQPTEAEFYCNDYNNYFPSFQVTLETRLNHIKLLLREGDGLRSIWERRVPLFGASRGPSPPDLHHSKRLQELRTGFVERISGPVLKSLLDRLMERKVITDAEGEAAEAKPIHRDRARFVVDTVRKKGEDASLEMIEFLKEADPFLCEHLELF